MIALEVQYEVNPAVSVLPFVPSILSAPAPPADLGVFHPGTKAGETTAPIGNPEAESAAQEPMPIAKPTPPALPLATEGDAPDASPLAFGLRLTPSSPRVEDDQEQPSSAGPPVELPDPRKEQDRSAAQHPAQNQTAAPMIPVTAELVRATPEEMRLKLPEAPELVNVPRVHAKTSKEAHLPPDQPMEVWTPEDHPEVQMDPGRRDSSESDEQSPARTVAPRRVVNPVRAADFSVTTPSAPLEAPRAPAVADSRETKAPRPALSTAAVPHAEIDVAAPERPVQLHEIRIVVAPARATHEHVVLRVIESHGEITVDVRTPDRSFVGDLRNNLPALIDQLENVGFQAESWHCGVPAAAAQTEPLRSADHPSPNTEDPAGRQQGGHEQRHEQRNRRQPRPAWLDEMEQQNRKWGNA